MKTALCIAAALALAGCGNKKDKSPEKTPPAGSAVAMAGSAGSAGSAAMTGSAGSAAGSAVDVPTEVDFEGQAKTDITSTNVDSKVKAIEDQLGSN